MFRDVTDYIVKCKICQENTSLQALLLKLRSKKRIHVFLWDKLHLNIVGPLPLTGHKYILTCQDNLSKYLLAISMTTQTADVVAFKFLQYVIAGSIITDQGAQFMGDIFKRLKIHKINTSAYHPESNGALERTHKTMVEYLRCFCNPRGTDWDKWLPFASSVYNATPHTMTQFKPYEILFGRKANVPGRSQQKPNPVYNYDDLVQEVKRKLRECHEVARANLVQTKQQRIAKQTAKVHVPTLQEGYRVLLRNGKAGKLDSPWLGPYITVEVGSSA